MVEAPALVTIRICLQGSRRYNSTLKVKSPTENYHYTYSKINNEVWNFLQEQ